MPKTTKEIIGLEEDTDDYDDKWYSQEEYDKVTEQQKFLTQSLILLEKNHYEKKLEQLQKELMKIVEDTEATYLFNKDEFINTFNKFKELK